MVAGSNKFAIAQNKRYLSSVFYCIFAAIYICAKQVYFTHKTGILRFFLEVKKFVHELYDLEGIKPFPKVFPKAAGSIKGSIKLDMT